MEYGYHASMRSITFTYCILHNVFIGKGGIRTPGGRKTTPIFKIGAINHSATFPRGKFIFHLFTHMIAKTIYLYKISLFFVPFTPIEVLCYA